MWYERGLSQCSSSNSNLIGTGSTLSISSSSLRDREVEFYLTRDNLIASDGKSSQEDLKRIRY
jgi:hypothetical protein